ncbi:hypothetical protein [Halomicrococcus gelatinilyticus]|uniref:hypothetical protein n=1 Tax=Halomicrococcus gelatinilyticus TaxID=1702103 RepID=UPI002E1643C7
MNADRRRLLGALAGVAAGGTGAAALAQRTGASTRVRFDAGDVMVTSDDGTLRSLSVAPSGAVSWSGLEKPAGSVTLALYAKLARDREYAALATRRLDAAGLHGETDYAFETLALLDHQGFSAADFAARDGDAKTTPVQLRFEIAVSAPDGTTLTTDYAVGTFVVTVRNLAETADVSGTANVEVKTPTATSTGEPDDTTTTERSGTTTKRETTTTSRTSPNQTTNQSVTSKPDASDATTDEADEGA